MTHDASMSPRQRRRARKTAAIVEAAIDVVRSQGLDNLTIQAVASRIDYTPGALYRYFDSKDALLAAMTLEVLSSMRTTLDHNWHVCRQQGRARLDDARARALLPLMSAWPIYLAFAQGAPAHMEVLSTTLGSPKILIQDSGSAMKVAVAALTLLNELANLIDDATEAGILREGSPFERAMLTWSSMHGVFERRKLGRGAPELFDTRLLGYSLLSTLWHGWGAPIEVVDEARSLAQLLDEEGLYRDPHHLPDAQIS